MAGTFTCLQFHLVFSTKNRKTFITPDWQPRLYEYMGGVLRQQGGVLYAIGGMPDHVHLLIRWRPDKAISDLLRDIKAASSGWVHKTFSSLRDFAWQDGYGAFSVSASQSATAKQYIENQPDHHCTRDFKEEFLALLHAHGIEYDPERIWW